MFPPGLQHNSGGVTKELLVKKAKLLNIDFPEESTKKSILDLIKIHLDKVASVAMPSGAILSAAISPVIAFKGQSASAAAPQENWDNFTFAAEAFGEKVSTTAIADSWNADFKKVDILKRRPEHKVSLGHLEAMVAAVAQCGYAVFRIADNRFVLYHVIYADGTQVIVEMLSKENSRPKQFDAAPITLPSNAKLHVLTAASFAFFVTREHETEIAWSDLVPYEPRQEQVINLEDENLTPLLMPQKHVSSAAAASEQTGGQTVTLEDFASIINSSNGPGTAQSLQKLGYSTVSAAILSTNSKTALKRGMADVYNALVSLHMSSTVNRGNIAPSLKTHNLPGWATVLSIAKLSEMVTNLGVHAPEKYINLFDLYNTDTAVSTALSYNKNTESNNHFMFRGVVMRFINALSTFCLTIHIMFDLKAEIVQALVNAKDRLVSIVQQYHMGENNPHSNKLFEFAISHFIDRVHMAWVATSAPDGNTEGVVAILANLPDTKITSTFTRGLQTLQFQSAISSTSVHEGKESSNKNRKQRNKRKLSIQDDEPTEIEDSEALAGGASHTTQITTTKRTCENSHSKKKLCKYFKENRCKAGDSCRFSHEK